MAENALEIAQDIAARYQKAEDYLANVKDDPYLGRDEGTAAINTVTILDKAMDLARAVIAEQGANNG